MRGRMGRERAREGAVGASGGWEERTGGRERAREGGEVALESDALIANVPLLAALAPLLRLGGVTMLQRAMKFASEKPTSLISKTSALADASIRRVGVTSGEYLRGWRCGEARVAVWGGGA